MLGSIIGSAASGVLEVVACYAGSMLVARPKQQQRVLKLKPDCLLLPKQSLSTAETAAASRRTHGLSAEGSYL